MSLRWKTILGIALIEGLLLLLLVYTALGYMRSASYDSLLKRAQTTASLFATTTKDAVLSYDLASLETFTEELMNNPDMEYARVIDADGNVFAASGNEVMLAQPFVLDQSPEQIDDGVFDIQANIIEGGEVYGRVQIGIETASLEQAISATQNWSITIASIEMVLVALFSFVLGTYLTSQLATLRSAAKSVAKGQLDTEVPIRSRDEIAEVGQAFNVMVSRLRVSQQKRDEYEAELTELNQTLEARVERRTAALMKSNDELSGANRQIQQTQAQLLQSEKMASLGQMAAGVAHEINNPVGFVMSNIASLSGYVESYQELEQKVRPLLELSPGSAEWLKCKGDIDDFIVAADFEFIRDDISELMEDAQEGSRRIRDIVQGLKEFSHVDQAEQQEADLNQCLETTLKIVNNELKYSCTIRKDLRPLPMLACSPGQLNQVFMNLLVNAGQAVGEEDGVIGIRSRELAQDIEIQIFDNGQGIEPDNVAKLFDPFFTTKPVGEGTGLGLAISYGIIQDHHGSITVKSKPGVGTCFTIRLPKESTNGELDRSGHDMVAM